MPYHVRITHKDPQRRSHDTLALDKGEAWIDEHIVRPRAQGRAIFVSGKVIEWDDVDEIHITQTGSPSSELLPLIRDQRSRQGVVSSIPDEWYVAYEAPDVTERFFTGPPGQAGSTPTAAAREQAEEPAAVMVVHGQDAEAARALFDWLRAVRLDPREWGQLVRGTGTGSPFIGDVLEEAFRKVQAVVALFTPDERVAVRDELTGRATRWRLQARPNVLFEAGMAFATHPDRTVLVVLGDQELPSDLAGRHYVRLGTPAALRDLAQRLETAGCPVDLSGDQWLDETRFPDRSGVEPEPRLNQGSSNPDRAAAYRELLSAHGGLVQAYSGEHVYDNRIRPARNAFDAAQSAVLVTGSPAARQAAEQLREAWTPEQHGIYMGIGWRERVEEGRRGFMRVVESEG